MRNLGVRPCSCRTGAGGGSTTGSGSCRAGTRRIAGTAPRGSCCTGTRRSCAANSSSCHTRTRSGGTTGGSSRHTGTGYGSTSGTGSSLRTANIRGCFFNCCASSGYRASVPLYRTGSGTLRTAACRAARTAPASSTKTATARCAVIRFSGCGCCALSIAEAAATGTASEAASTGAASKFTSAGAAPETVATNRSLCRPGACACSCCTGLGTDCTPDIAGGSARTGRDGAVSAVPCCGGPIALAGIAARCGRHRGRRA